MRVILIKIIQALLWLLDRDHRIDEEIHHDVKKFTHVEPINSRSDFGTATNAFRTIPYRVWEVATTGHRAYAADRHIVIGEGFKPHYICDLQVGDMLMTDTGLEPVTAVRDLGIKTHQYCIEIDAEGDYSNLYYGNGILSHNTTCAAAFILWKTTFTDNFTVLVAANKHNQAMEIVQRIKESYEELPNWLKAGVLEYNKAQVRFDNNSRIIARATTPDAGRGLSISLLYCLDGETTVTVREIETGEVRETSLSALYGELGGEEE